MLRPLYFIIIVSCILPTVPGLLGAVLAAFGYVPPIGLNDFSLLGFHAVFNWPGISRSIGTTILSALLSSYLACLMTFAILQSCWNTKLWRKIEISLSPLLAMPHVAFAIGFAFLFAPTGMIARALYEIVGDQNRSQTVSDLALLVKDQYALGLTLMLALKEVPFLLLMSIPILQQLKIEQIEKVSHSLGYSSHHCWWKAIYPQWFVKLRFPMLAVMAYSVSVVDVALIIGPTHPPTFAVLVWQWFNDPDLSLLPRASAGAVLLFILATLHIALARCVEWIITKGYKQWQYSGRSGIALPGKSVFFAITLLTILIAPLMVLWSLAQRWRFPDLVPARYSIRFWQYEWTGVLETLTQTISIAIISATIATLLALAAHEYRLNYRLKVPAYIIAIPMLIPQLSILFGIQIATLYIKTDSYFLWVCWAHVFFAFPYVYLSLDGPWRSFDNGLTRLALSLGKAPFQTWVKIKLPILLPAVTFAWAIGISVSLAQYLPTLTLGAGRVTTITTEAVALSSGYDRRISAIYALCQALLPLIFFSFAILLSRMQGKKYRNLSIKGLFTNESVSRKPHHL